MARPALEVAGIIRDHGPAWRIANEGHVSLDQMKVMTAIERCLSNGMQFGPPVLPHEGMLPGGSGLNLS